jgi:hypothetical protein
VIETSFSNETNYGRSFSALHVMTQTDAASEIFVLKLSKEEEEKLCPKY